MLLLPKSEGISSTRALRAHFYYLLNQSFERKDPQTGYERSPSSDRNENKTARQPFVVLPCLMASSMS